MAEEIGLNLANIHHLAIHEFREVLCLVLGFTFKTSMIKGWRWESILRFTHTHTLPNKQHSMQSLTQHKTITNCDECRQSILKRIYFMFVIALKKHTIALSFQQIHNTNKPQTVVLP